MAKCEAVRGIGDDDHFRVIIMNLDTDKFSPPGQTPLVHDVFPSATLFARKKEAEHVADPDGKYGGFGGGDGGSTSGRTGGSNNDGESDAAAASQDGTGADNAGAGASGGGAGTDSGGAGDIVAQAKAVPDLTNTKDSGIGVETPTHSGMASRISQAVRKGTSKISDEAFELKSSECSFFSSL